MKIITCSLYETEADSSPIAETEYMMDGLYVPRHIFRQGALYIFSQWRSETLAEYVRNYDVMTFRETDSPTT